MKILVDWSSLRNSNLKVERGRLPFGDKQCQGKVFVEVLIMEMTFDLIGGPFCYNTVYHVNACNFVYGFSLLLPKPCIQILHVAIEHKKANAACIVCRGGTGSSQEKQCAKLTTSYHKK